MNSIRLSKKFAGIFASSTLLILGTVVLLRAMSLEFDYVFFACKISITGAIMAGIFGYAIGKIFEASKDDKIGNGSGNDSDLLIDDLLINDLNKIEDEE